MTKHTGKNAHSETTNMQEQHTAQPSENQASEERSIPAIRHVGPTLESDPGYLERARPAATTPEAQIAQQAGTAEPAIREIKTAEVDPITGQVLRINEPEPLKTRLPGDTSSDPHTDVGADNAATVQHRGEREPNAGRRNKHAA